MNQTTINNNNNRVLSAAGLSLKDGCVTTRVPANITVNGGGKFEWGGMGEKCQHCDRPAYIRWRKVSTGEIVAAACRAHEEKARP